MRHLALPALATLGLACASAPDVGAEKPASATTSVASTQVARLILDRVP